MPLRNLRRTRTMNQETFARLVGISQQSLSKIERGILIPSADVQALIAAVLGVPQADIFPAKRARATTEEQAIA